MDTYQIIVIGGGFAGVSFIKNIDHDKYKVLLIDKLNYHQFQPLFYQVASARIEPSSISFPLRKFVNKYKNTDYRLAEVERIDYNEKVVHTDIGAYRYEKLVIATGCNTNYYGNEEVEKWSMPMKSMPEALTIRNNILLNFEKAAILPEEEKEPYLNIVVVGGGATGVEMSGSFAELKTKILPKDFPRQDFSKVNVYLIEGSGAVLGAMSAEAQSAALSFLKKLGVQVILNNFVKHYDGDTVELSGGMAIKTKNVVWAAGIKGNILGGIPEAAITPGYRITVDRYFKAQGMQDVYVMGDIAHMVTEKYPKGHPQVATVAIAQSKHLALNMNRPDKARPYEYKDKGSMATVGKRKAVVDLKFIKFNGVIAWFFWMFLHLMLILSVRNKMIIFINWMISYFTNNPSLRLIMHSTRKDRSKAYFEHSKPSI